MKINRRMAMGCLVATLAVGSILVADASIFNSAEVDSSVGFVASANKDIEPVAGVSVLFDKEYLASVKEAAEVQKKAEEQKALEEQKAQEQAAQQAQVTQPQVPEVKSEYDDIAIAQVNNYVNIRNAAGEHGEILGKLYNNSAATIVKSEGDWYQITSGTVTGYVKAEFFVTGSAAAELAKTVGQRIATVTTETLRVRDAVGLEAPIQTLVPMGEELDVVEELDGWVKVSMDADVVGYVSADYVSIRTEFVQAESLEEEKARLAEAERQRREAEEAARKADEAAKKAAAAEQAKKDAAAAQAEALANANTANVSGIRQKIVSYALQFVGNPYRYGGTSLTNGADCSGFVQSVFRDCGYSLGRSSRDQASAGKVIDVGSVKPGDLLFYSNGRSINHVAIYIGNGQVVHASTRRTGIKISNYNYRQPCKAVSYLQ